MKKNLFKISEEDRNRILEMHIKATKNKYLFEQETPTPAPTTPTTPTPSTATTNRHESATCEGKSSKCVEKALKAQILMNDQCPSEILTTKLTEDGIWGQKSNTAWESCKGKLKMKKMEIKPASEIKIQYTSPQTKLAGTTPTTTTTPVATTTSNPQISADLKTAAQIKQEFRQGQRDQKKLKKQYDKMKQTFNKLSDKMDEKTKQQYLNAMSSLENQMS
jgi:hypothetical protein